MFQRKVETFPEPDANGVVHGIPWRTAKLDEGQIQELLEFALGPGGLGTARDAYIDNGIADAPNTIFTINAGGLDKTVVVNALGEDTTRAPTPRRGPRSSSSPSGSATSTSGGTISTDVYAVRDRYRGVLIEREPQAGPTPTAWPWPAITLTDFKESETARRRHRASRTGR